MSKRGRRAVDRTDWMRPGGPLPRLAPDLTPAEQRYYEWLVDAMETVGVGGAVDLLAVQLAARLAARADECREAMRATPPGDPARTRIEAELGRTEARLREMMISLYLVPRTRGSTRLPKEAQADLAAKSGETEIAQILRRQA